MAPAAPAPAWAGGPPGEPPTRPAPRRSLQLAAENDDRSVAFPVLGSGVGGFPFETAARLMLEEIREHVRTCSLPEVIVLYGYGSEQAELLRQLVLVAGLTPPPDPSSAPAG